MDSHKDLVDVLLLSHCNVYERYPELVERVDYFLHEWTEKMLARTESHLRKQSRAQCTISAKTSGAEDETFTHLRSRNVVWRQWAVCRLQLPRYPPESINWNKDADPVFLYGQTPVVRLEVPWSEHSLAVGQRVPIHPALKPAIKRTDLQTFLTSPTLSPVASPPYSPLHSPALSVRESMSTSSLTSDSTLENDMSPQALKPRLRFNDKVEQCMVVFNQEKEYLPTDYEDDGDGDGDGDGDDSSSNMEVDAAAPLKANIQRHARRPRHTSSKSRSGRGRHTLVIKLAPTHLKGDHRNIATASSRLLRHPFGSRGARYSSEYASDEESFYYSYDGFCNADEDDDDDDDEDPFADTFTPSACRRQRASERTVGRWTKGSTAAGGGGRAGGVSGYVQGCVQSVAGQVRKLVSDAVAVSSFTPEKPPKSQRHQTVDPAHVVSDPYASYQPQTATVALVAKNNDDTLASFDHETPRVDAAPAPSDVVRDPFASTLRQSHAATTTTTTTRMPPDHIPFDDDEDAIIQQFEREMQKYNVGAVGHSSLASRPLPSPDHHGWDNDCEFGIHRDAGFGNGDADDEDNEFGFGYDVDNDYGSTSFDYSAYNNSTTASLSVHSHRSVSGVQQSPSNAVVKDPFSTASSARESSNDITARANGRSTAALPQQTDQRQEQNHQQQQQQHGRVRNESIIDRAEDTIVNTVDAVKWCASFISNYTIF